MSFAVVFGLGSWGSRLRPDVGDSKNTLRKDGAVRNVHVRDRLHARLQCVKLAPALSCPVLGRPAEQATAFIDPEVTVLRCNGISPRETVRRLRWINDRFMDL